ncbi:3793_t:CDS:2, partial [Dentiscutata heterogama]
MLPQRMTLMQLRMSTTSNACCKKRINPLGKRHTASDQSIHSIKIAQLSSKTSK